MPVETIVILTQDIECNEEDQNVRGLSVQSLVCSIADEEHHEAEVDEGVDLLAAFEEKVEEKGFVGVLQDVE